MNDQTQNESNEKLLSINSNSKITSRILSSTKEIVPVIPVVPQQVSPIFDRKVEIKRKDLKMTEEEKNIATSFIGKYQYTRVNLDSRTLELLDDGNIGEGKAGCERRWTVRLINNIPHIICIGAAHKNSEIAMFFAKDTGSGKNFEGQWTAFEKCNVTLERL